MKSDELVRRVDSINRLLKSTGGNLTCHLVNVPGQVVLIDEHGEVARRGGIHDVERHVRSMAREFIEFVLQELNDNLEEQIRLHEERTP